MVRWRTPDDGQRNCPKQEMYSRKRHLLYKHEVRNFGNLFIIPNRGIIIIIIIIKKLCYQLSQR